MTRKLRETEDLMAYPEVRRAAHDEIQKAADSCAAKLAARRSALEEIARILMRTRRTDGIAVAEIIARHGCGS